MFIGFLFTSSLWATIYNFSSSSYFAISCFNVASFAFSIIPLFVINCTLTTDKINNTIMVIISANSVIPFWVFHLCSGRTEASTPTCDLFNSE